MYGLRGYFETLFIGFVVLAGAYVFMPVVEWAWRRVSGRSN